MRLILYDIQHMYGYQKKCFFQDPTLGKINQFFCNTHWSQYFDESTENFNLNLQLTCSTMKHFNIFKLIVLAFTDAVFQKALYST